MQNGSSGGQTWNGDEIQFDGVKAEKKPMARPLGSRGYYSVVSAVTGAADQRLGALEAYRAPDYM
jgi:hypothetical protein